mgnify:CR=1 FL=1
MAICLRDDARFIVHKLPLQEFEWFQRERFAPHCGATERVGVSGKEKATLHVRSIGLKGPDSKRKDAFSKHDLQVVIRVAHVDTANLARSIYAVAYGLRMDEKLFSGLRIV